MKLAQHRVRGNTGHRGSQRKGSVFHVGGGAWAKSSRMSTRWPSGQRGGLG